MADKDLQVRFVGNTSDLAGNIDGVSGKFGVFAKGVAAAGAAVGTGLLAAGKGLLDIGATFDSVSDNIRSTTGATGAALDGLVGSAKNVGTQVPSSFEDVSVAVGGLHQRLGITGPALEGMAAQVLDLSRLTGTDLKTNIDSVTRVFGDWGIKTADQANTMDKLFVASQQTGVGVDKLSENVVKFGAPLRQLGFNFDQSIALLGKFEKEGVNTELVMGSMRIALGKMAKAGQDPVATFREITEKIKNAGDAGTANKLALELFGAKAGPDMAAAIREGRFAIDDLVKTIGGSEGAIQAAAEGTADFAEQWQILKNKAFVALEPVAARVFGMINERMSQLADWFERNQSTVQSFAAGLGAGFGIVVDVIGTVVAAVFFLGQALAPVVAFLGRNLTPILIGLSPILAGLAIHFTVLGVQATIAAAKTAIAWVTATAGAVVSSVTTVAALTAKSAAWIRTAAVATASAVRLAASWVIAMGPVGWVIAAVVGLVALIVANWDTVVRWTSQAWGAVSGFVAGAWRWISDTVRQGVDFVRGVLAWFGGLPGMFHGWFWGGVNAVGGAVHGLIGWVAGIPGRVLGALGNLGGLLWRSGVALVSGFWDGIVARWNQMVDWVRQGMANLRALWPFSPAKKGPFSGKGYVTHSGKALTADFAESIRRGLPGVVAAVRGVVGAAQGGFSASIADVAPVSAAPAGARASTPGPREVSVRFVGNGDQAVATLIMNLIRSGKIQLTV